MISNRQYKRPPLIEGVLELRFEEAFSERDLTRLKDRLVRSYPAAEEMRNFQVKLEHRAQAQQMDIAGYKLTAKNAVDVVLIQQRTIATSRLAPYLGWENLTASAKANYGTLEKVAGYRKVVRLGARFVNRIDIPLKQLGERNIGDLLNIQISIPGDLASSRGTFSLATNFVHGTSGVNILAQVGTGDPVLIEHASIFLDIDASIEDEFPPNIENVWALLDRLQEAKDKVFESFITDEIRDTFR
jgi:uncharacterized protein (TIGR04255 family)